MKKVKQEERRKYVKDICNKSKSTDDAIAKLADELFLSEKTIRRDFES